MRSHHALILIPHASCVLVCGVAPVSVRATMLQVSLARLVRHVSPTRHRLLIFPFVSFSGSKITHFNS